MLHSTKRAMMMTSVIASTFAFTSFSCNDPAIDSVKTRNVMKQIVSEEKAMAPKLLKIALWSKKQVKKDLLEKFGMSLDDATIMKDHVLPYVEFDIRKSRDVILKEFNVNERDLEEAVVYYIAQGDEELKSLLQDLQTIRAQFASEIDFRDASFTVPTIGFKAASMDIYEAVSFLKDLLALDLQQADYKLGIFEAENGAVPTAESARQILAESPLNVIDSSQEENLIANYGVSRTDMIWLMWRCMQDPQVNQDYFEATLHNQVEMQKILKKHGIM